MKKKRKFTIKQLEEKAPKGEFLAYISPKEAKILKSLGGSGKKINGIPSFFASSPGDTGGAGGADGAGGTDGGGSSGGSTDTGDLGSEAANAAATAAGAASVGVGSVGPTDPGIARDSITSFGGNLSANARSMGARMAIPGATAYTALKSISDTQKGRKAMGLSSNKKSMSMASIDGSSASTTKSIPSIQPSQPLTPENKVPFNKITFVRASKGSMVSTRGTKSIQVQGHKKTKLY